MVTSLRANMYCQLGNGGQHLLCPFSHCLSLINNPQKTVERGASGKIISLLSFLKWFLFIVIQIDKNRHKSFLLVTALTHHTDPANLKIPVKHLLARSLVPFVRIF